MQGYAMNKQKSIERRLEQAILEGRWKLFEHLPAERALAEEFAVNRSTLRSALSSLAGRGILETIHGSGSRVRALPGDVPRQDDLSDKVAAARLLVPPIMHACSMAIRPSQILGLERILPVVGTSLRNNDTKTFVQAQLQFFMEAAGVIGSTSVSAALSACMPRGKALVRLFCLCSLPEKERLFAHLARILSAMRHADAKEAAAAAQAYFSTLQSLEPRS